MEFIRKHCAERGVRVALSEVFAKGGEGGEELAREVLTVLDEGKADFHMLYEDELPLEEKIRKIAKEIYGADGVTFAPAAHKELANITDMGYGRLRSASPRRSIRCPTTLRCSAVRASSL